MHEYCLLAGSAWITQVAFLYHAGMALPTVGWVLPYQSSITTNLPIGSIFSIEIPLSGDSTLFQVAKKKNKTKDNEDKTSKGVIEGLPYFKESPFTFPDLWMWKE